MHSACCFVQGSHPPLHVSGPDHLQQGCRCHVCQMKLANVTRRLCVQGPTAPLHTLCLAACRSTLAKHKYPAAPTCSSLTCPKSSYPHVEHRRESFYAERLPTLSLCKERGPLLLARRRGCFLLSPEGEKVFSPKGEKVSHSTHRKCVSISTMAHHRIL